MRVFEEIEGFELSPLGNGQYQLDCPEWITTDSACEIVSCLKQHSCFSQATRCERASSNEAHVIMLTCNEGCSKGTICSAVRETLRLRVAEVTKALIRAKNEAGRLSSIHGGIDLQPA